ncbi:MAG: hypothetical protein LBI69_01005 [Puniceicoccales bacterium]|jgi:hypothetical protein|nr:hypothetical protein [Puniceicoccales bacterium]
MVNWRNHSPANGSPTWNSPEQKQLNLSEKTDQQNSSDRYIKVLRQYSGFSSLFSPQDMWDSEWEPCLDACPTFSIDQLLISQEKHSEEAKRPSPSNPPAQQSQIYSDKKKFDMFYAVTLEKLNSQSATVTEIVDQLIWQGIIGPQILQKLCDEEISKSAEQIPEAIATWTLNALENVKDPKILALAINALEGLSCTDFKFMAKILNHMEIIKNLGKITYLLEEAPMNYAVKFLSILPPATQARLLMQMTPVKISDILCMLSEGDQVEDNSNEVAKENAIRVLLEMGTHNSVITLM